MTNKVLFVDIGEMGWSLYLAAYIRWIREYEPNKIIKLYTFPDRVCLYEGLAHYIELIPNQFYIKFKDKFQNGFGLMHTTHLEIRDFLRPLLDPEFHFDGEWRFSCRRIFLGKMIWKPYPYKSKPIMSNRILIFPRYRHPLMVMRNLPLQFWKDLTLELCVTFPNSQITSVGTVDGSYSLRDTTWTNFIDYRGLTRDLQQMIDMCQEAVCAIGSASAPPKLTALQGLPTYTIGHEKERVLSKDNWGKNKKLRFWEIKKEQYNTFSDKKCIDHIIQYVKGLIHESTSSISTKR